MEKEPNTSMPNGEEIKTVSEQNIGAKVLGGLENTESAAELVDGAGSELSADSIRQAVAKRVESSRKPVEEIKGEWKTNTDGTEKFFVPYGEDGNLVDEKEFLFEFYLDPDNKTIDGISIGALPADGDGPEWSGEDYWGNLKPRCSIEYKEKVLNLIEGEMERMESEDGFVIAAKDPYDVKTWRKVLDLNRKVERGEDITQEEFKFIWDRDETIDSGRVLSLQTDYFIGSNFEDLTEKFGREYAIEKGYICPEVQQSDIEKDVAKYLENDMNLESNLLTYVLSEKFKKAPKELENILCAPNIVEKLKDFEPGHLDKMLGLIEGLKTYKTRNYVVMLPAARPGNHSEDMVLSAVVRRPVAGRRRVGMETKEFSFFNRESADVVEWFLESEGYYVPGGVRRGGPYGNAIIYRKKPEGE